MQLPTNAGKKLKSDLKSEFNQDISALKSASYDAMLEKVNNRYKPTENQVL